LLRSGPCLRIVLRLPVVRLNLRCLRGGGLSRLNRTIALVLWVLRRVGLSRTIGTVARIRLAGICLPLVGLSRAVGWEGCRLIRLGGVWLAALATTISLVLVGLAGVWLAGLTAAISLIWLTGILLALTALAEVALRYGGPLNAMVGDDGLRGCGHGRTAAVLVVELLPVLGGISLHL
jgi:hypothetical protein